MCPKKSGISVYFVCKLCRSSFRQVEHFLEHKKEKHFDEFRNLSCIIFEERVIVVDQSVTSPIVIEDDDDDDDEIQLISVSPTTKISSSKSDKQEEGTIRISNTPVPSTESDEIILIDHSEKSTPQNSGVSPETDDGICIIDPTMPNELNCISEKNSNKNNVGKVISGPECEPESKINKESNVCLSIKPKDELILFGTDSEDSQELLSNNNQSQIQITATTSFQIVDSTTAIAPLTTFEFEFTCGLCLRNFESESHLKIHTGICSLYSVDNDRYCAKCNIKFHLVLELKEHDLNCHQRMIEPPADDGRKFSCSHPNCEKRFKTPRQLNDHVRIHTGERPYKCTVNACNEMFRTSSCLSRHRRKVHLNAPKAGNVSGKREARKTYFQT